MKIGTQFVWPTESDVILYATFLGFQFPDTSIEFKYFILRGWETCHFLN